MTARWMSSLLADNQRTERVHLLKLSFPLAMSDPNVSPICLPSISAATLAASEWPPAGTNVVAVGWERLTFGGSSSQTLQQVTVQTVANQASTCNPWVIADRTTQLCAGVSDGGKDTCQGNSGGPLMMFSSSNQRILVGLTSFGYGCVDANNSGVYTCVATYQS